MSGENQAAPPREEVGDLLAAAFETTRMPMLITDARQADNPIVHVNEAFLGLTGYAREEVVGHNCRFLQGPATDPAAIDGIRDAIGRGDGVKIDILNYRKDGSPFWNALYVSPVRARDGRLTHFFASQLDVTGHKETELALQGANAGLEAQVERRTRDLSEALRAKELLLHEVDHRVKNNLQLVASLLSVQARRIPDPVVRASLQVALERVGALSTLHQTLYETGGIGRFDVAAFGRRLAQDLLAASGRDDVTLELNLDDGGRPLEVPAAKGAPLALAVNELLTNALRHAFPGGRGGTVRLAAKRLDGGRRLLVEVTDDGVGLAKLPPEGGFGTTLVRSLARQLAADLAWEPAAAPTGGGGVRARLTLSLEGHAP